MWAFEAQTTLIEDEVWNWALFTTVNSDLPGSPLSLALEPQGGLWIGTQGRGLAHLLEGQWKIYNSENSKLPSNTILALAAGNDGEIWIGTDRGLAKVHQDLWEIFDSRDILPANKVLALASEPNGGVWIGTNHGLTHFRNGKWESFDLPKRGIVKSLARGANGEIWVSTTFGGLMKFHEQSWKVIQSDKFPINSVTALAVENGGDTWVGTRHGLARLHQEQWEIFKSENSDLPDDAVGALTGQSSNELWIATASGSLIRFVNGHWTLFDPQNSPLSGETISALVSGDDGQVWIGTDSGTLMRLQAGYGQVFSSPGDTINAIATGQGDEIWVGTNQGLARRVDAGWEVLNSQNSQLPDDGVLALEPGQNGELWIGTSLGLARLHDGQWETFNKELPEDTVQELVYGTEGDLWIGTVTRIVLHRGGQFQILSPETVLSDYYVSGLALGHDGELWVGTGGGGLLRFRNDQWDLLTAPRPLPDDLIFAIERGAVGNVWVGTRNGLLRLKYPLAQAIKTPLPDNTITAIESGQDGEVWFGTLKGLARLHRGQWQFFTPRNSPLPNGNILALSAGHDGGIWVATQGPHLVHLEPRHNPPRVKLVGAIEEVAQSVHSFAAIAFDPTYRTAPGRFRYEWHLQRINALGSSEAVSESTTRSPFFSATNLRDGTYELLLAALDQNSFRSFAVKTRFRVKLPKEEAGWLQTTLLSIGSFLILYAVLILPLLTLYSRWSVARTALNSGLFSKFPWFHKAVLDTAWSRQQLFRSLADRAVERAKIPDTYVAQAVFPAAGREHKPTPIDGSDEGLNTLFADQVPGRALLLGRSGTGKSVLLHFLWREAGRKFLEKQAQLVPVFVNLSGYPLSGKNIEDLLREALRGARIELPDEILDFLIRKGGFLLLFDSLNELPNPEKDATAFHPFFQRDSGNQVILASQVDVLRRQDLAVWRIAEVTPEQARNYLREETGNDVWDDLPAAARDLARNPQDLALLAEVVSNLGAAAVPTERAALYREMLYQDSALKAWVDSGDPRLDAIYGLALRMVAEQRVLDDARLVEWLRTEIEQLEIEADPAEVAEKIRASRLFREESERSVLGGDEAVVTFRHELIGKFLASRRLRRDLERDQDVEALVERAGNELWVEVFTFLLDELDSRDHLNRFLSRLVDEAGPARLRLVAHGLDTRENDVEPDVERAYLRAKVADDVERPARAA